MTDPQPRGQKPGDDPQATEHQAPPVDQPRPESPHPAGHSRKPIDRPKDDPSEAPESGDRKATGDT